MPDQDDAPTTEEGDEYASMEVLLTRGYKYQNDVLLHRKQNVGGKLIGFHNSNPIFDTRVCVC